ncbi:universal stress protein [Methanosarcina sp. Ant1]|nr:universal stress protein [Methanosarcina sp. Ant1]
MNNSIFRKIMLATDGSESARKAVDSAIEIAKSSNAKLYAVHVIALGDYYSSMPLSIDAEWITAMEEHLRIQGKEATDYVENAGRAANVEVEPVILEGNPANEIVDFAEKNDIDLIVMGTQGKTGIQRFLIGSVAENVVRHSIKTVLVVK